MFSRQPSQKLASKTVSYAGFQKGKGLLRNPAASFYFPSGYLTQGNHDLAIIGLHQRLCPFEELPCSLRGEHHKLETA
jgi:hypothetical protein